MSTPIQFPKTNIAKINRPSTSTAMRDNNSTDEVSLLFRLEISLHKIASILLKTCRYKFE